jgi:hypothetical protein
MMSVLSDGCYTVLLALNILMREINQLLKFREGGMTLRWNAVMGNEVMAKMTNLKR